MNTIKNKVVGVTGATGFVGSYVIRELMQHGYQNIVGLKRSNSDMSLVKDIEHKIQWKDGDLLDIPSLEKALQGVDQLIHTAALVSFNQSDKSDLKKINIEGTRNIVNLSIDLQLDKFIHLSSVAAIGRTGNLTLIDENSKWEESMLNSPYAKSKRYAELEVWRAYAEGLPTLILNPSVILGAAFWSKGSSAIIPRIIKGVPFYPKGATGFVDVRDVAKAVRLSINSDKAGERYILNAANLTYRELFEKVCSLAARKAPSKGIPDWTHSLMGTVAQLSAWVTNRKPIVTKTSLRISSRRFSYDNTKSVEELGLTYRPIDQTIRETTEQFLLANEADETHGILSLAN